MADGKFNLNGLWRQFSLSGNETLNISVYAGQASLVVFKKGSEQRTPAVKMNLSSEAMIAIRDILRKLLDAQPGTRSQFTQMEFDKETRVYKPKTNFVFFKDEKRCYGVEISSKFITTPAKFVFKAPATFTTGTEPLTDEKKSLLAVKALDQLFGTVLPMANLLSRFNMEPPAQRQRYNGGNNRNSAPRNPDTSKDPFPADSQGNSTDVWD